LAREHENEEKVCLKAQESRTHYDVNKINFTRRVAGKSKLLYTNIRSPEAKN